MGRGRDDDEPGDAADEAQAAMDKASSSKSGSGTKASLGVDKQYGGGYGGGYPYGSGYGGYGYPSYYCTWTLISQMCFALIYF